tara:strand:- start:308 stop:1276 length:969 start_codon:yes stop_codon:yes gene_type:complete
MASSTTYNTAGNRQDLTDILTILEPEKTPLTSIAGKKKATGTHFEWQLDSLSDPSWSGVNEGEDISSFDNKAAARARVGNYIQKFRRTWMVSDLQQLVSTAGVASEAVNSASKSVRELKRDLESAICSVDDWAIENGTGTPYRTRGMLKWLGLGGQPADVPAAFQSVASDTTNPQTESTFNSVLQSLYTANGMPNGQLTLIAGPTLKSEISNFSRAQVAADNGVYNITQSAESKKITLSVNLYEGDFGNVAIIPSTFVGRTRTAPGTADPDAGILVDPEYVDLFTLKAESADRLEDQGGGERGYCEIIAGLAVSPKAHGYFN